MSVAIAILFTVTALGAFLCGYVFARERQQAQEQDLETGVVVRTYSNGTVVVYDMAGTELGRWMNRGGLVS